MTGEAQRYHRPNLLRYETLPKAAPPPAILQKPLGELARTLAGVRQDGAHLEAFPIAVLPVANWLREISVTPRVGARPSSVVRRLDPRVFHGRSCSTVLFV